MRAARLLCIALAAGVLGISAVSAVAAEQPGVTVQDDRLVVPGRSVGRIGLGMQRREVTALLGTPPEATAELLEYHARRGGNRLSIHLSGGRVTQIDFTSRSFRTRDGIGTRTYADDAHAARFRKWLLRWRFANVRYTLRNGGLTFYGLNVDSAHDDYPAMHVGVVHAGADPPRPALELEGEPNGGWTRWDGRDIHG
ncbi:MAG TPA: hypothetical protein VFS20_10195, partial [Longimicrobium sp.]|nr:hypothetical protein [Longimicrobium sp.]